MLLASVLALVNYNNPCQNINKNYKSKLMMLK